MIYIGYQGIGKSTLCRKIDKCIDLESGNFFVDGKRPEDWYKIYANIAQHLSDQGNIVFMSSHKVLRDYMSQNRIPFTVVYPAAELKGAWLEKLKNRYDVTKKDKDFRAWINAQEKFEENIQDLSHELNKIEITDINYNLESLCLQNTHQEVIVTLTE